MRVNGTKLDIPIMMVSHEIFDHSPGHVWRISSSFALLKPYRLKFWCLYWYVLRTIVNQAAMTDAMKYFAASKPPEIFSLEDLKSVCWSEEVKKYPIHRCFMYHVAINLKKFQHQILIHYLQCCRSATVKTNREIITLIIYKFSHINLRLCRFYI